MRKHFWTRLISAVLTMAMAFSICVLPASAASDRWAIRMESDDTVWFTDLSLKKLIITTWDETESGELTDEEIDFRLNFFKYAAQQGEELFVETGIPSDAYFGMLLDGHTEIIWYGEEGYDALTDGSVKLIHPTTGVITLTDGSQIYPIGYEAPDSEASSAPTTSSTIESGSADGAAAILLLGVGAIAATVTVILMLPVEVSGTFVDQNGEAVANALISVQKNGVEVAQTMTDTNGFYSIKVRRGNYELVVSYTEPVTGQNVEQRTWIKAPEKERQTVIQVPAMPELPAA